MYTCIHIVKALRSEADEVCQELDLIAKAREGEAADVCDDSGKSAALLPPNEEGQPPSRPRVKELQSEIGDVLFNALLLALVAERDLGISAACCFAGIRDKIIRRCPHVFGDETAVTVDDASALWMAAKAAE